MKICIISSSFTPGSRSDRLAVLAKEHLRGAGATVELVRLKDHPLPPFSDEQDVYDAEAYKFLHKKTENADSVILASPVYNWACCAELKKYIEFVGSTPPDGSRSSALFDKVVSFLTAGGLPHSYMAAGSAMLALMLDFKCIINPHQMYAHDQDWTKEALGEDGTKRLMRTLGGHMELTERLSGRPKRSSWSI